MDARSARGCHSPWSMRKRRVAPARELSHPGFCRLLLNRLRSYGSTHSKPLVILKTSGCGNHGSAPKQLDTLASTAPTARLQRWRVRTVLPCAPVGSPRSTCTPHRVNTRAHAAVKCCASNAAATCPTEPSAARHCLLQCSVALGKFGWIPSLDTSALRSSPDKISGASSSKTESTANPPQSSKCLRRPSSTCLFSAVTRALARRNLSTSLPCLHRLVLSGMRRVSFPSTFVAKLFGSSPEFVRHQKRLRSTTTKGGRGPYARLRSCLVNERSL